MNRSIQILSIVFMLALASAVSAQISEPCGIVEIDGPSNVDVGARLVFKVKVTNTSNPEFKWDVSVGTIIKGQGTDEIEVDTAGLGGLNVTAKVELIGAPSGCKNSASSTTPVIISKFFCGLAFDQYGDIKFEDEKARLDNFAIQISSDPHSSGLILMYAGQKTFKREAAYRLGRARTYLVNVREIDSSRLVTVDCGFNQDLTLKLWIVPQGARFPECDSVGQILLSEVSSLNHVLSLQRNAADLHGLPRISSVQSVTKTPSAPPQSMLKPSLCL